MIVTILWEDQRGGVIKGFGPQTLLEACLRDRGEIQVDKLSGVPRKGIGNLLRDLRINIGKLTNSGPVIAVIDRDRIREQLPDNPAACMQGLKEKIHLQAPGNYEVVFLVENIESLVADCCMALGEVPPPRKLNPIERDQILSKAAWAPPERRLVLLSRSPSFARLVAKVAEKLGYH